MARRPSYTEKARLGDRGISLVDATVRDQLGWIFRAKRKADIGIDGEIEITKEDGETTGRLLAVQIKCGESHLSEKTDDGYIYRGDLGHLDYWLDHSLPVVVVLCDPNVGHCWWVDISPGTVERLKKGWKVIVPFANRLDKDDSKSRLRDLGRGLDISHYLELALHKWLHEKYFKRIEICGVFELPRDYHWYEFLVQIDDETVMVHYLYARYGRFEIDDLESSLRYQSYNGEQYGADQLILCLIAESMSAFKYAQKFQRKMEESQGVSYVRMLLRRGYFFDLCELADNDTPIMEFIRGEPIDDFGASV